MPKQEALFLIKPNAHDLLVECVDGLLGSGLSIDYAGRTTLTPDQVALLYPQRMGTEHESRLINIMTSGESIFFLVSGDEAVEKIKQFKGKTYSGKGLRGKYAVDFIDNKVHSTDGEGEYLSNLLLIFTKI
jgi:nucleoside diphosphate kinase